MKYAERLGPLDLAPPHTAILRVIQWNAGISQQALSSTLGIPPSRLVSLLDDLENRGLVERRNSPEDRRVYALHLTAEGLATVATVQKIGLAHDNDITEGLSPQERATLGELLRKIADQQGLKPGVHPALMRR